MSIIPAIPFSDIEIAEKSAALLECSEFMEWFGGSEVREKTGLPQVRYHGTDRHFEDFDPSYGSGGIHFGTHLQAVNRLYGLDLANARPRQGARIIPVYIKACNVLRMKEQDSWSESDLARAQRRGYDAIVYLNRREGLPLHRFNRLKDDGWLTGFGWPKIQKLSDEKFLDLVPEASDSYIVFDASQIMSVEKAWAMLPEKTFRL